MMDTVVIPFLLFICACALILGVGYIIEVLIKRDHKD